MPGLPGLPSNLDSSSLLSTLMIRNRNSHARDMDRYRYRYNTCGQKHGQLQWLDFYQFRLQTKKLHNHFVENFVLFPFHSRFDLRNSVTSTVAALHKPALFVYLMTIFTQFKFSLKLNLPWSRFILTGSSKNNGLLHTGNWSEHLTDLMPGVPVAGGCFLARASSYSVLSRAI